MFELTSSRGLALFGEPGPHPDTRIHRLFAGGFARKNVYIPENPE